MSNEDSTSSSNDFDFLQGEWTIRNRRRTNAFERDKEAIWDEFPATHRGEKYLDGNVIIEHFEGAFSSGEIRKGMTIRTFDPETQQWSIVWLDNRSARDFTPWVGKFEDGVGRFYQVITAPDGQPVHVLYMWDQITANSARWQQAFSFDGGKTWDLNWVSELTR